MGSIPLSPKGIEPYSNNLHFSCKLCLHLSSIILVTFNTESITVFLLEKLIFSGIRCFLRGGVTLPLHLPPFRISARLGSKMEKIATSLFPTFTLFYDAVSYLFRFW